MTTPADIARIDHLVLTYPHVNLADESRHLLEDMADRWLRSMSRKHQREIVRATERRAYANKNDAARSTAANRNAINSMARRRSIEVAHRWLPDLLGSSFALPNGQRVRWRDATIAQHEERATALELMAAGDIETAGIHRRAVNDIRLANADTLGGIAMEQVAA